jgi:hypothetical protein
MTCLIAPYSRYFQPLELKIDLKELLGKEAYEAFVKTTALEILAFNDLEEKSMRSWKRHPRSYKEEK